MEKTKKNIAMLASGLALITVVGGGSTVATAADVSTSANSARMAQARAAGLNEAQAAQLQNRVDQHLKGMKAPARQVNYNTVRTNDGAASITFSAPGQASNRKCQSKRLCLWAGDNYDHRKLVFYKCGFKKLRHYNFTNKLTSYKNYQTRGTRSKFYKWDGKRWDFLFSSVAPHKEADLQGTPWNNVVDAVRVC